MTARTLEKNLLKEEQDGLTEVLNKVYLHSCCPYFYLTVAVGCVLMILWVLIAGKAMIRTIPFRFFELFINLFIIIDIICKIYIMGIQAYFQRFSNILEFSIGVFCVFMYVIYYLSTTLPIMYETEILENIIFCCWCMWQVFRIVTLFYKQKRTQRNDSDNISFSKFHDEIDDEGGFIGKPSDIGNEDKNSRAERLVRGGSARSSIRKENKVSQSMCE